MTTFAHPLIRPTPLIRRPVVPDPPRLEPDEVLLTQLRNHRGLDRDQVRRIVGELLDEHGYTRSGISRLTGISPYRIEKWARAGGSDPLPFRKRSDIVEKVANIGPGFSSREIAERLHVAQRTVVRARARLRQLEAEEAD